MPGEDANQLTYPWCELNWYSCSKQTYLEAKDTWCPSMVFFSYNISLYYFCLFFSLKRKLFKKSLFYYFHFRLGSGVKLILCIYTVYNYACICIVFHFFVFACFLLIRKIVITDRIPYVRKKSILLGKLWQFHGMQVYSFSFSLSLSYSNLFFSFSWISLSTILIRRGIGCSRKWEVAFTFVGVHRYYPFIGIF